MSESIIGPVIAIAVRTARRGPMREVPVAEAQLDGGLSGDLSVSADRGVTLLSARDWAQVRRELGADLPWHTRRANVLIDADGLGGLIGQIVRVGDVELEIKGETRPCGLMDELHNGLRAVLTPDCRAGVHGRVRRGGRMRVGDSVAIVADPASSPAP